jgi:hypothetical protein
MACFAKCNGTRPCVVYLRYSGRAVGVVRTPSRQGYWRRMKGSARIRLRNGTIRLAELHWYEAHGIGKKEFKRKRYLD